MTPKEKAEELVDRFREFADGTDAETDRYSPNIEKQNAKQCALIAVDEIFRNNTDESKHDYWIKVKEEIEKL